MAAEIAPQLAAVLEHFNNNVPPPIRKPINQSRAEIQASFERSKAPQIGSILPEFSLQNCAGETVNLGELLTKPGLKGLLITFYRGGWCPFCNIALHGLQNHARQLHSLGVDLVAISPELPDQILSTKEKNLLQFEVLSDLGTEYAREIGIMWQMPEYMKPTMSQIGNDFKKIYGDDRYTLPIPTTILIDKERRVKNVFVEPDYTKRLEPATAVKWARALR